MTRIIGWTLLIVGSASFASAGLAAAAPEIDPASGMAALALLSGGLLILRARPKK
jgi:hypothetical protein